MRRLLPIVALLGVLLIQPLYAHQRSESFSEWRWETGNLELRFTVAAREASRIAPDLPFEAMPDALARYLPAHIGPGDGDDCEASAPFSARLAANGFLVATAAWHCKTVPGSIRISAFQDVAAEHAHLATFRDDARSVQEYLHAGETEWEIHVELAAAEQGMPTGGWNRLRASLVQGVSHALGGTDHLLFLLGLMLVCRRLPALVWAITGFTIGHSVSLALAVMGVVIPVIPVVEAVIGLTIALVAAERLGAGRTESAALSMLVLAVLLASAQTAASAPSVIGAVGLALFSACYLLLARDAGQLGVFRMGVTVLFGLVHGLGFATAFQVAGFPTAEIAWSLVGFNLGVEAGQMAVVVLAWLAGRAVVRVMGPRPLAADVLAAAVCGMGVFWFVTRSVGA